MKDDWFRWEREAAIHLLFPTFEGSMQPLEKFTGFGFPTTILIFKNGIVTWCVKNTEFYGLGAKLLEIYKSKDKEVGMVDEAAQRLKGLEKVEERIKQDDISGLPNEQLTDLYTNLHDAFVNYYGIGAIQEPLVMQGEIELWKTGLSSEEIAGLVALKKSSYIKEAENFLLQTRNIEEFIKKYYWIDNNYSQTKVISKEEAQERLNTIQEEQSSKENSLNVKLSAEQDRLIELLINFASYQDERKRNILIYLHYLEILLKEVGKRSNLSLNVMRDTFPHEIKEILGGKITEDFIKSRREKCFIVWKEKAGKPLILIGDEAKEWEKVLTPQLSNSKIIKGNCASKGKVTGKVRVLLNASENDKLENGEILVTFMTSPDFMSAVRRSSAIVTNLGGVTSHAAIISRELGIPCVVGTKNATEILKTGDMVEVNADKGEIRIL